MSTIWWRIKFISDADQNAPVPRLGSATRTPTRGTATRTTGRCTPTAHTCRTTWRSSTSTTTTTTTSAFSATSARYAQLNNSAGVLRNSREFLRTVFVALLDHTLLSTSLIGNRSQQGRRIRGSWRDLDPWKYVRGVRVCSDPSTLSSPKMSHSFIQKLFLDNSESFTSSRMKDLCQKWKVKTKGAWNSFDGLTSLTLTPYFTTDLHYWISVYI